MKTIAAVLFVALLLILPKLSATYGAFTWYGNGETSVIIDDLRGS